MSAVESRLESANAGAPGAGPSAGPDARIGAVRRAAAVLFADMVGYTRLMQVDEEDTARRMMQLQAATIEPRLKAHGGRLIKHTGDGFLATFDGAREATECAAELQRALSAAGASDSASRRISFRMAVHYAELLFTESDVFGDGVNVAARLQTFAEPGGIVLSEAVARAIEPARGSTATSAGVAGAKLAPPDEAPVDLAGLERCDLGHLPLRGIAQPVRAYGLQPPLGARPALGEALPGAEGRPSIVVLPFRELNARAGTQYFAEGIVDDIVHALSGLKELFVIARGSTLGFRNRQVDVRAIGRELGVRYVMHGSVQRTDNPATGKAAGGRLAGGKPGKKAPGKTQGPGGHIRILTELCNAESGEIVYADSLEGALDDLFGLQRRIAHRVVMILAPQVRERERLRAMRKSPHNMTAYDLVLQALGPLFAMDYDSFSLAHGLLMQAIAHDPQYGAAYSYASYWHLLRVGQGWSTDTAADTAQAARMAESAIALDENDALALAINGHVHSYLKRDLETAVELQERALEVGPSCAMAWTLSSVTRGYLQHGPMAVARAEHGLQLSPRGPLVVYQTHILSQAYYVNGDYDAAVHWGRKAARQNERLTSNLRCLIASLVAADKEGEARRVARRLLEIDPAMNLTDFARRTPLPEVLRDPFVDRLRAAGLPD
jgi:adenylate cyclase